MNFNRDRLLELSGISNDASKATSKPKQVVAENARPRTRRQMTKKQKLQENMLRTIIREELEAYLKNNAQADRPGFPYYEKPKANRSVSRGPGGVIGFGGPGFM